MRLKIITKISIVPPPSIHFVKEVSVNKNLWSPVKSKEGPVRELELCFEK